MPILRSSATVRAIALGAALGLLAAWPLLARQTTPARPTVKGIWEPVSFAVDLNLGEVVFVTVDRGWAAGDKGTIIHTRDGGATWTAQLGGDPEAAEGEVTLLRFVDEQHGWAAKDGRILRTADGESWEDLGAAPQYLHELAMSSPTDGVAAGYLGMGRNPSTLLKTRDGGRTWTPVTQCAAKAMVGGLARTFGCEVLRIQFVTAQVGFLVARHQCAGAGCAPPPILGRTEDGGDSWQFFVGPGDPEVVGANDLFFTDERTGIVRTTDGKLSRTTDGGATWTGLVAGVGPSGRLGFADPEVGWAVEEQKMSYTVDGGGRWNSRPYRFPASPRAWAFPRRDRAYVVGDHGMVFRYRVVPATEPVAASVQAAPVMPAFTSPIETEMPELATFVQDLTATVEQLPDSAAAPETTPPAGGFAQDTSAPTPFVASCCGKPFSRVSAILASVLQSLPQFVSRFKNTNLLTAGLRMFVTLPGQLGDVQHAFTDFKRATDKPTAQAALARLGGAAAALHQSTRIALQKEVAP